MIKVDCKKEIKFTFSANQLKKILVDALRIDGNTIPEEDQCDFEIYEGEYNDKDFVLTFSQDSLDSYIKELEDLQKEEEAWETTEESGSCCKGCCE